MANIKVSYHPQKGLVQEEVKSGPGHFEVESTICQMGNGSKCVSSLSKIETLDAAPKALETLNLKNDSVCWLEAKIVWKNKTLGTSGFFYCMSYAQNTNGTVAVGPTKCIECDTPGEEDVYFKESSDLSKVEVLVMAPPGTTDTIEWHGRIERQEI